MDRPLTGIHHVTAITSDPQKNIDFYCGVLGLRLVKVTVNFDDPGSYHLYYGDELGRPGTIMTFFAWPGAPRSNPGPPQVTATAFAVPASSMDYWSARLKDYAVTRADRLGDHGLSFADPDGMALEVVAVAEPRGEAWSAGAVPVEHAIRGFHSVTISEEGYESTAKVLTDLMGFRLEGSEGNRFRYEAAGSDGFASIVDLLCVPDARRGGMGAGIVHHVAFRTPDDNAQDTWQTKISKAGLNVSPVMDRNYFHSIYYREPGGVLFEIATDEPGFTADETREHLGTSVMLPLQYEGRRAAIERVLPKLRLPGTASITSIRNALRGFRDASSRRPPIWRPSIVAGGGCSNAAPSRWRGAGRSAREFDQPERRQERHRCNARHNTATHPRTRLRRRRRRGTRSVARA